MRIIHVVPAVSEEASGPSYSVVRLCESIIDQGHDVTLATLDWAPISSSPNFLKTFPLGFGPRRLGSSPSMRRWLSEQCSLDTIDILHNHGMWQLNSLYPSMSLRKGSVKLVQSPRGVFSKWAMSHGSKAKRIVWPLLQLPALKKVACFHATALAEYEDIRCLGFNQPVAVIPNGIKAPQLLPQTEQTNFRTLLFLGRIHPTKGLDMLLPAWRAVQDRFPEWRLEIDGSDDGYYGPSGYRAELISKTHELDLKRIEFLGPFYGVAKWRAYRNASLFVLPSYSENFGMTVAEALSVGTPVIVTKGAPWSGLTQHNAGWWIDIGIDPLVTALNVAMSYSEIQLKAMGERGRIWMESDFTWGVIARKIISTYQWLLDPTIPIPEWVRVD
jgi:glycosyltransferase involved in cell wall biosynthesis